MQFSLENIFFYHILWRNLKFCFISLVISFALLQYLEDTARYEGFLLAPAEGFGLQWLQDRPQP